MLSNRVFATPQSPKSVNYEGARIPQLLYFVLSYVVMHVAMHHQDLEFPSIHSIKAQSSLKARKTIATSIIATPMLVESTMSMTKSRKVVGNKMAFESGQNCMLLELGDSAC